MEITLDPSDTYTVRRVFTRGVKRWIKGKAAFVYCDQVADISRYLSPGDFWGDNFRLFTATFTQILGGPLHDFRVILQIAEGKVAAHTQQATHPHRHRIVVNMGVRFIR